MERVDGNGDVTRAQTQTELQALELAHRMAMIQRSFDRSLREQRLSPTLAQRARPADNKDKKQ